MTFPARRDALCVRISAVAVFGGGRSLERTVLQAEFPANREIYREFHYFDRKIKRVDRSI
jgi:hypothetical protein